MTFASSSSSTAGSQTQLIRSVSEMSALPPLYRTHEGGETKTTQGPPPSIFRDVPRPGYRAYVRSLSKTVKQFEGEEDEEDDAFAVDLPPPRKTEQVTSYTNVAKLSTRESITHSLMNFALIVLCLILFWIFLKVFPSSTPVVYS